MQGTVEPTVDPTPSMDSMQDYALPREEHEGTLGPVKYAVLTDLKREPGPGYPAPQR